MWTQRIYFKQEGTCFGNVLSKEDLKFRVAPPNLCLFREMMTACIKGTIDVLERQYRKYFNTVETSTESVLASVSNHTMVIASVIGEYYEKKRIARNEYVCCISHIIKAKRNDIWNVIN